MDAAINTEVRKKTGLVEFYGGFKGNLKHDKLLPIGTIRIELSVPKKHQEQKGLVIGDLIILLPRIFPFRCFVLIILLIIKKF